jgi:ABC-type branched-subunit amino acid transport system substrate-binding protein
MPRYQLSQTDMADLLAYLETAADPEPGVAEASLRLGIVLPSADTSPEIHRAIRQALTVHTDGVNAQGGLYGRRIELRFVEAPTRCAELPATLTDLARNAFALVAPFVPGCEAELAAFAEKEEIPVVGPLVLAPPASPTSRLVFFLDSGPGEAASALAHLARRRFESAPPAAAILYPPGIRTATVTAFRDAAISAGFERPREVESPHPASAPRLREIATQLHQARIGLVFFLGPAADLADLLAAARETGWSPRLIAPGTPTTPWSAASAAVTAARLFAEGTRRAGHDLTREKLVAALEGFYRFETAGSPPITFGSGRRIGVHGTPFRLIEPGSSDGSAEAGWIELDGPVLPSQR